MIRKIAAVASVGLLLSSQVAIAADSVRLGAVQGSVLVNQDGRFVPVTSSTVLRAGDRVMAMNGSATINYGACATQLTARSMATVGADCGGSSNVVKASYNDEQEGYGSPSNPPGQGWDFWVWTGFGIVSVSAIAIAVNDSSDPSSP